MPQLDRERWLVVAGMSRAGTTFLYHNLQKHPQIFAPARKELCFFAHNFHRGEAWLESFYRGRAGGQIALDICGHYFTSPEACERIHAFSPSARVVIGIRRPSRWAASLYEQYRGNFKVPPLRRFFDGVAIEREGVSIAMRFPPGFVAAAVERFQRRFGDRLLVYDFRLLQSDSLALLRAIGGFAGLEPWFEPGRFTDAKINARGRRRLPALERLLQKRGVATAIARLVPRGPLLRLRNRLDAWSSGRVGAASQSEIGSGDREYLAERFAEEDAYVERLFAEGPLVVSGGAGAEPTGTSA